MGEYLAAPALLDEPAVQQSFLSYFNTIVVSPGDGACLSWSVMRALLLMPPCVREHLSCPAQRFLSERLDCIRKEDAALRAFHDFCLARDAQSTTDCLLVLEEFVLMHQANERQELDATYEALEEALSAHGSWELWNERQSYLETFGPADQLDEYNRNCRLAESGEALMEQHGRSKLGLAAG